MPQATPEKKEETMDYQPTMDPARKKRVKVIVHRLNVDDDNKDLPITVNDLGDPNGRIVFSPGKPVDLTEAQLNILRDSVEESEITVPEGSGMYETANPLKIAEDNFPGFTASRDRETGLIKLRRRVPNFMIEIVSR